MKKTLTEEPSALFFFSCVFPVLPSQIQLVFSRLRRVCPSTSIFTDWGQKHSIQLPFSLTLSMENIAQISADSFFDLPVVNHHMFFYQIDNTKRINDMKMSETIYSLPTTPQMICRWGFSNAGLTYIWYLLVQNKHRLGSNYEEIIFQETKIRIILENT